MECVGNSVPSGPRCDGVATRVITISDGICHHIGINGLKPGDTLRLPTCERHANFIRLFSKVEREEVIAELAEK